MDEVQDAATATIELAQRYQVQVCGAALPTDTGKGAAFYFPSISNAALKLSANVLAL